MGRRAQNEIAGGAKMHRNIPVRVLVFLSLLSFCPGTARSALACPFCSATSQTFSEELATMDVAVIAKLVKLPPASAKAGDEIEKATFEVTQVIKGEGLVKAKEKIETLYF